MQKVLDSLKLIVYYVNCSFCERIGSMQEGGAKDGSDQRRGPEGLAEIINGD